MLETLNMLWNDGDAFLFAYVLGAVTVATLLLLVLAMLIVDSIVNRKYNRTMRDLARQESQRDAADTGRILIGKYRYNRPHAVVPASLAMATVNGRNAIGFRK